MTPIFTAVRVFSCTVPVLAAWALFAVRDGYQHVSVIDRYTEQKGELWISERPEGS